MNLLKYIPLQFTFFLILGISIGFFIPFSSKEVIIMICSSFFILIILYILEKKKIIQSSYFMLCSFIVFIAIGIASTVFQDHRKQKNYYSNFISKKEDLAILQILKILKPNAYANRYFATLTVLNSNPVQGVVLLHIKKDSLTQLLAVDSKIIVSAVFQPIQSPKNPYQFDYRGYLQKQQIYHQIYTDNSSFKKLNNTTNTINGWAYSIRNKINTALKKAAFKGEELAIINALLLGQRQEVSPEMLQNYQNAGAIHILAVSGLHIGILLFLLNFLFQVLEKWKYGTFIKLLFIVFLLWLYAFIAGMSASIIRAVTMFTAVAISFSLKKSIPIYKTLVISMFFLLLYHPYYLFDVGFQLSYVAVFFIVFIQPKLYKLWQPKLKIIDYFWQLFTVSIAAQIGVLPLSLHYFHQFPGLFFVSNLLIIPFLGIILGLGILVIILALTGILPTFLATFYEQFILLLNTSISFIGKQKSFVFEQLSFTWISIVLYFLIILFFFIWLRDKKHLYLKLTLSFIILFQGNLILEKWRIQTTDEFVIFYKRGSTIIAIRNGNQLKIEHRLKNKNSEKDNTVKSYLRGTNSKLVSKKNKLSSLYNLGNEKLLVVDSLGVYAIPDLNPEYVLLVNSPKINLERLLGVLAPKLVIVDASNYKNQIKLWHATCKKYNTKFYFTGNAGAFVKNRKQNR